MIVVLVVAGMGSVQGRRPHNQYDHGHSFIRVDRALGVLILSDSVGVDRADGVE